MLTAKDVVAAGRRIYDEKIKSIVEPQFDNQFVAIDIESGDYEIDPDEMVAIDRLRAKHPNGHPCLLRVGYRATHWAGATSASAR